MNNLLGNPTDFTSVRVKFKEVSDEQFFRKECPTTKTLLRPDKVTDVRDEQQNRKWSPTAETLLRPETDLYNLTR